jgi:response regulator NasT
LRESLENLAVAEIDAAGAAAEARTLLRANEYGLCVINMPLPDESGERLAREIMETPYGEALLLIPAKAYDVVRARMEPLGVITVSKPLQRALFENALKIIDALQRRADALRGENRRLTKKLEDARIIDRAKCLLVSCLSMTEPEAHRYIEKRAMDTRVSRREIADEILKTYRY